MLGQGSPSCVLYPWPPSAQSWPEHRQGQEALGSLEQEKAGAAGNPGDQGAAGTCSKLRSQLCREILVQQGQGKAWQCQSHPGREPGLLTCAPSFTNSPSHRSAKASCLLDFHPKKPSQNDLAESQSLSVFPPLLFFHFHSLLYFWILARTEAEMPKYWLFCYFCILSNLESPSSERKGILISVLTQFCRPRQLEKHLSPAIYLN